LVEKIEAELKSRIPEGDPMPTSEREQLASLQQLSGMLAPALGAMLKKLLGHWEAAAGVEEQRSATARDQLEAENADLRARCARLSAVEAENAELRARCEKLTAAAGAAAASLAAAGADEKNKMAD
jgi:hypothetical protein